MKILVYGAGVIGTLYAAKLQGVGHRVTVLARKERLVDIRRHGLTLENVLSGVRSTTRTETTDRLAPEDDYDLVIIAVRRDQLTRVLPELAANERVPTFLFMLNNPIGSAHLGRALGAERVVLGFPGAGGARNGSTVSYAIIAQQPTTLGELGGEATMRLKALAEMFRNSGFPTTLSRDIVAWLKVHAIFITAIGGAIYLAGGDCGRLSKDEATLKLMTKGIWEGFKALRALGVRITPFRLKVLFLWCPEAFAVHYWRKFFAARKADYVFGRHARATSIEMREIAADCRQLLDKSSVQIPALRKLYQAIDAYAGEGRSSEV